MKLEEKERYYVSGILNSRATVTSQGKICTVRVFGPTPLLEQLVNLLGGTIVHSGTCTYWRTSNRYLLKLIARETREMSEGFEWWKKLVAALKEGGEDIEQVDTESIEQTGNNYSITTYKVKRPTKNKVLKNSKGVARVQGMEEETEGEER